MKTLFRAAALCLPLLAGAAHAENILAYEQPKNFPEEFNLLIEIPAGTGVKYETNNETGNIIVDRFMAMPVAYPANYGSITRTKNVDGDPLDALVITRMPIQAGAIIRVRPIGLMKMIDGGDQDDKIIAVPVSKVDPTYADIKSLDDLPKMDRERLLAFFRVYKQLPEGSKVVEMKGFDSIDAAKAIAKTAGEAYGK
jgi:inorganic pyrophosphatase